jgi:glycine cleavage system regulatory protein
MTAAGIVKRYRSMITTLVITVMGTDRSRLVEALSKDLAAHHGNWLESRIAGLGGRFAGILAGECPGDQGAS